MKKIQIELSDYAPYNQIILREDDVYRESRNVYLIEQRAFKIIIDAQMTDYIVREYKDWDQAFQEKMIEKYRPNVEGINPLMPRMTVEKYVDLVTPSIIEKLFNKEKKEKTIFQVNFGNGRHRFNLLRHFGAKNVPFQLTSKSADNINEMFGSIVCSIIR